jgi:adenosine deaminase
MAPAPTDASDDFALWRAVPKVLLHEHLDGGLRAQTLLELCKKKHPFTGPHRTRRSAVDTS